MYEADGLFWFVVILTGSTCDTPLALQIKWLVQKCPSCNAWLSPVARYAEYWLLQGLYSDGCKSRNEAELVRQLSVAQNVIETSDGIPLYMIGFYAASHSAWCIVKDMTKDILAKVDVFCYDIWVNVYTSTDVNSHKLKFICFHWPEIRVNLVSGGNATLRQRLLFRCWFSLYNLQSEHCFKYSSTMVGSGWNLLAAAVDNIVYSQHNIIYI